MTIIWKINLDPQHWLILRVYTNSLITPIPIKYVPNYNFNNLSLHTSFPIVTIV